MLQQQIYNSPSPTIHFTPYELNNRAVEEIYLGNVSRAMDLLLLGLDLCLRDPDYSLESMRQPSPPETPQVVMDDWMSRTATLTRIDYQHHGEYYLYNEPITIPAAPTLDRRRRNPAVESVQRAITLSFNLGLCYHSLAEQQRRQILQQEESFPISKRAASSLKKQSNLQLQDQDSNNIILILLNRSLAYWEYSFRLKKSICPRGSISPRFFMAIINNLGVLYQCLDVAGSGVDHPSSLSLSSSSRECFDQLLALYMYYITTTTPTSRGSESVSSLQWQGYFHNATMSRHQEADIPETATTREISGSDVHYGKTSGLPTAARTTVPSASVTAQAA